MCIAYYGEKTKTLVAYSVELPSSWDSYLLLFQSQSHVRFSSPSIFYLSPYQSDNKNTSTILTQRSNLLTQTPEGKNKNAVIDSHNIHFTYSVPSWFSSLAVSLFQEASAKCPALHRYNPHACRSYKIHCFSLDFDSSVLIPSSWECHFFILLLSLSHHVCLWHLA